MNSNYKLYQNVTPQQIGKGNRKVIQKPFLLQNGVDDIHSSD